MLSKKRGITMAKIILPGTRLLIYLISVITTIAIDKSYFLFLQIIILLLLIIITRKTKDLAKKLLITIPFLITAALIAYLNQDSQLIVASTLISKLIIIVMLNTLLLDSFNESSLLKAMKQLHFATIITSIAFFIFSYRKIIINEINRLRVSRKLRGGKLNQNWFNINEYKIWGQIIGASLIKSLDRGDRVFQAMTLRGLHTKSLTYNSQKISTNWKLIAISILIALFILYINYLII